MTDKLFSLLRGGIVVSCQAEADSPFNSPEGVCMFAVAAVQGGAAGIRSEGVEKTRMILSRLTIPVIGLVKSSFEDGTVRITGRWRDLEELMSIGTPIIAVDGTFRRREGLTGPEFIARAKQRPGCVIMADVSTEEEGLAAAQAGADCISTTLSGYTPSSSQRPSSEPDYSLVATLAQKLKIPLFAEGRVRTPAMAAKLMSLGAWSVVVGTSITRPAMITKWYVDAVSGM